MKYRKPVLFSLTWALAIILSVFLIPRLIGLNSDDGLYSGIQHCLNDRLASAVKIFALTKVIAGTLTFLQNLQIDLSVVFAGISITPLSALEPVSYTLNIISNLFLFAVGAILLEKALLTAGGFVAVKMLLPIAFALAGVSVWISGGWKEHIRKASVYTGLIAVVVWLSIPLSVGLANLLDRYFLNEMTENSARSLEERSQNIAMAEKELSDPENYTAVDSDANWLSRTMAKVNIKRITNKINSAAAGAAESAKAAVEDMLRAFTAFFVTTILIPVATVLILWFFLKRLILKQ
jgi:hypothetical protein